MMTQKIKIPYSRLFSKKKFLNKCHFEELNFSQHHDFENKYSFLLWNNKNFVEFIFKDNMLNEIFKNEFLSKITRYNIMVVNSHAMYLSDIITCACNRLNT